MRCIRLPAPQNVAPSSRVSLRLPLGVTYEKIYFILGTNILQSLISNIVVRINNKEFMRWNAWADYQAYLNYKGNGSNAGNLVFDFTERKARDEVAVKLGTIAACAEAGVQDMTIEFDLGVYTAVATSTHQRASRFPTQTFAHIITPVRPISAVPHTNAQYSAFSP